MFKREEESKKVFDDILGHVKRSGYGEHVVGSHFEPKSSPMVPSHSGRLTSHGGVPGAQAGPGQVVR
jgi:hypothetical protein